MAGSLQIEVKTLRRRPLAAASGALLCSIFLAGCSMLPGRGMEKPYSFEDRPSWTAATRYDATADPFASRLCVIQGETQDEDTDVSAEAAAVFGLSDNSVIYSKHAFEKLYPASITKVMTAIIAIKYGNLDDEVTVTQEAVITEPGATLCGIKPGDRLTMRQLLYGLMLPSGNDAGAAIAVHMSENIDQFCELMNREAHALGATNTHFVNPHGLNNEEHYTTAYDLYLIFNEALKLPEFREVTGSTSFSASYVDGDGQPVNQIWKGGNYYLTGERKAPEGLAVFSGKTGTTKAAGYCLIMASRDEENREYVSVVLKAGSRPGLYDNMTNIIGKIVN